MILLGPSAAGKSTCYQVLAHVLTKLSARNPFDIQFAAVFTKVVNPKAFDMGELFGYENEDTKDWVDGLASRIIRRFAKREQFSVKDETKDGPEQVDPFEIYDRRYQMKYFNKKKLRFEHQEFWTVFDGPIDAKWIENMNTVLDDNMLLSLPNGERIKLNKSMHMLFEVGNVLQASPATISRCGMVFMPSDDVGWRPYVFSWI